MTYEEFATLKAKIKASTGFSPAEKLWLLEACNAIGADRPVVVDNSPNYLARIDSIWAVLSIDEGGEGLCAAPLQSGMSVPLIAADEARLKSIVPMAEQMAKIFQMRLRLVRFHGREELRVIDARQ